MPLSTPDGQDVAAADRSHSGRRIEGMRSGLLAACALALVVPATAAADGLPVTGIDVGPTGVTTATSTVRYVTVPAGDGETLVARVRRRGGQVLRSRVLRGSFTVPAVALDGTASGLSADRRTLVLIRPRERFPQRATQLAVLDARRLALREVVELRGDFSFDALSPDGRTMYLIEYPSRRDPTRYAVRGYDVGAFRLLPEPVVDPSEPDERMRGIPITRATSRRRPLGVHALRRRRVAPVRARARHGALRGAVHRPRRAHRPHAALRAAPAPCPQGAAGHGRQSAGRPHRPRDARRQRAARGGAAGAVRGQRHAVDPTRRRRSGADPRRGGLVTRRAVPLGPLDQNS